MRFINTPLHYITYNNMLHGLNKARAPVTNHSSIVEFVEEEEPSGGQEVVACVQEQHVKLSTSDLLGITASSHHSSITPYIQDAVYIINSHIQIILPGTSRRNFK